MFIEFIEDETHAVHEGVHVRWLALVVGGALMRGECSLERLPVLHPLDRKVVWSHIRLVEDKDERKFCFVEDTRERCMSAVSLSWIVG